MSPLIRTLCSLLGLVLLAACASGFPPPRIDNYVSPEHRTDEAALSHIKQRPLRVGLVVVSDTAAPDAAPNLPDEALVKLSEKLTADIEGAIPVTITEVIPADHIRPEPKGDWDQLASLARQRGLDYLALVILSSTEQEYPVTLFLGWVTHMQPGLRRDNWSLLEFALLDVKNNRTLLEAQGRGWATLDRPTAPDINQWYPVVYLRPQDPQRRIWPPTYEGAPNTLRVVSFDQAEKRLAVKLQKSWVSRLEAEAEAGKETS
ncbi:MAG TPA: hypothetical protein VJ746_10935 [Nitrospira sp.]|nr:hypothetical protein [Nitrospira sp.]